MALAFDFRAQIGGPWESARGYMIEQLDLLYASLGPIGPLLDGLSTGYGALSVLTTNASGVPSLTTTLPMPLGFVTTTTVTPTALTVNTNDYAPNGLAAASVVRMAATGAINVTGLAAATGLSVCHLLVNIGAFTMTLTHADAASASANRWRCPGAANFNLTTGKACWIWYDATSTVWQVVG